MSDDLQALLRTQGDAIERPRALPAGTYTGTLRSHEFGKSKNKGTPQVTFQVSIDGAEADVDQEALSGIDLSAKTLRSTYYLTKDSQYRLVELADSCGQPTSGISLGEIIDSLDGAAVLMSVSVREEKYNDITKMVGAA